jgi:poly(3-hydroxybutyrate) depolymerase
MIDDDSASALATGDSYARGTSLAFTSIMSRRSVVMAALIAGACWTASSEAATAARAPCRGCTLEVPRGHGPRPLLVVLHGDGENADDAAARWRGAALPRGWAVLALQCPRERGCVDGSWYQWRGAPDWVQSQVDAVVQKFAINRRRIYLVGWSGGATYLGMNAASWAPGFAAVVLHGGGQPPEDDRCPARRLPAYFLVGDRNPAHPAVKRLRSYLEHCGEEIRWDLVAKGDHAAEDQALDHRKAARILAWLQARPRLGALPPTTVAHDCGKRRSPARSRASRLAEAQCRQTVHGRSPTS